MKRIDQYNPVGKAKKNVAHHYDLSGALYDLFLDRDRQYSCAYFEGARRIARRCAAGQEAPPRRQADDQARHEGARHRLGLGRARPLSGRDLRRRGDRRHPVGGTAQAVQRARRAARRRGPRAVPAQGLPPPRRALRPHRLGRHVRACGRRPLQGILRARCTRAARRTTVSPCCTRSTAPTGRAPPAPGSRSTSSPAAISRPCRKCCRRSRGPASTSPTSRSCACTMPRRCANGRQRFADHRDRARDLYDERFCRMWEFYLAASRMRLPLSPA